MLVFKQPLLANITQDDNQAMLDLITLSSLMKNPPDNLASKVAATVGRGKIPADLVAAECGVSVQAVNGWKKDGRVDKKHIKVLASLTGLPPVWWLPGFVPGESEPAQPWPFQRWLDIEELRGLDEGDLGFLAGKLSEGLQELRGRSQPKSPKKA